MDAKTERIRLNEIINKLEISFLKKVEGKKLICFGTSDLWLDINRIITIEDLVEFFVDRDISRWGESYFGKEIKSPNELRKLDKDEYAVVILDGDFEEIGRMLERRGWEKGKSYFVIYQYIHVYKEVSFSSINKYLRFLETVPTEMVNVTARKKSDRIGIVLNAEGLNFGTTYIPYLASLFLILKWKGYDVKLIVDRLHWEGDIELYEGHCAVCDYVRDLVISKLEKFVLKDDILYIDSVGATELSLADEQECERIARYSVTWSKWYNIWNSCFRSDESVQSDFADIFKKNLSYINSFFEKNHFDTINAITTLHKMAGVYYYAAKKRNIRVSSQDGIMGQTIISADGPSSYSGDIPQFLERMWDGLIDKKEIMRRAVQMWEKRREATVKFRDVPYGDYIKNIKGVGYDKIILQDKKEETIQPYDVIIPLNLMCDGAALGIATIFGDIKQWLEKTLDYVINKLNGTVLIREHPAGRNLPSYMDNSEVYMVYPEILEPYKGNSKLRYVKSEEEINLYQYIEKCKVLIPWTSTIGVEAGVMGKNVLIHTDVYYQNSAFAVRAHTEAEYFEKLKICVNRGELLAKDKQQAYEEALRYFYYGMNRILITDFTIVNSNNESEWKFGDFEQLLNAEGVDEIVQIVADNVPSVYLAEKQRRRLEQL